MRPSPVTHLRSQLKELQARLAEAEVKGDLQALVRYRASIARVENYLRSWGVIVR